MITKNKQIDKGKSLFYNVSIFRQMKNAPLHLHFYIRTILIKVLITKYAV